MDRIRRVVDRGPLHPDKDRVSFFATQMRSTGLYEYVAVEQSSVKAPPTKPGPSASALFASASAVPAAASEERPLNELSLGGSAQIEGAPEAPSLDGTEAASGAP